MQFFDINKLDLPLKDPLYQKIQSMITADLSKCYYIVENFIENAKLQGHEFSDRIEDDEQIKEVADFLDFNVSNSLMKDAEEKSMRFIQWLKQATAFIEKARKFYL